MAKDDRFLTDCPSSKLAFSSRAKAMKWVRHRRHKEHRPVTTYQCSDCGLWHLTTRRR